MLTTILYALILFIPGYLLISAINCKKNIFLFSISSSLAILTALISTCLILKLSRDDFYFLFLGTLSTLIFANFLFKSSFFNLNTYKVLPYICIVFCVFVYQLIVGPYIELPSDIYIHLDFFEWTQKHVINDRFHNFSSSILFRNVES